MKTSVFVFAAPAQEGPDPPWDLRALLRPSSWARILPPSPGHNPKRWNSASGWSWAPGRALEADFPEQQGAPDTFPSASQAEQQEQSCLAHGIRQRRTPSRRCVPVGRELDTDVHGHGTCFLFGRQRKNTAKACRIEGCNSWTKSGKCSFAANGSAGELRWGVFTWWNHSWESNVLTDS